MKGFDSSGTWLCRSIVGCLFYVLLIFGTVSTVMAVEFNLSGTLQDIFTLETQPVTGTLNIYEGPSMFELDVGSGQYTIDYDIDYSLVFNEETYNGSGTMRIRESGAGLFDNQFVNPLTGSISDTMYHWIGGTATFYDLERTPYPAWVTDSLAYATIPYTIEFQYGYLEDSSNIPKYWITDLSATRSIPRCWICEMLREYLYDCPRCPWVWIIPVGIVVVVITFRFRSNSK